MKVAEHVAIMLVGIAGGFVSFGYWLYLADPKNNPARSLRSLLSTSALILVWLAAYVIGKAIW
ncbi:MAG TPA: hypothetical protein VGF56_07795 [Rhizomicrobium sp.]